jgi:hypothetical protein
MFDVSVRENADAPRLKRAPIAHRFRGGAFDQAFVGDIGVGPLIDAHEMRACRARDRQRLEGGVGQDINPDRQSGRGPEAIGRDRHMRPSFGTDVLGFRKRNVAVVLDDEAVKVSVGVSSRIAKRPRIDRLDAAARIVWRRRQRQKVDDADQHAARPTEYGCERGFPRSCDGGAAFRHCSFSSRRPTSAHSRIAAISSRDGKEARTPFRVTDIEAASTAAASAPLQPDPTALAVIKTPQNTSPAPTVSMAMT